MEKKKSQNLKWTKIFDNNKKKIETHEDKITKIYRHFSVFSLH